MTRKVKPGSTPPHLVDATGTLSANRRLKMSPVDRAKIIEEHDSVFQMLLDNVESPHDVEEKIRIKEYGTCRSMVATAQRPSRIRRVVIIIMLISMAIIALVVPIAVVFGRHTSSPPPAASWAAGTWNASNFKNLVTFGDSYTDEARGLYYQGHNGQFPPPGWIAPVSSQTAVGGYVWPRWLSWYSGATLYNYAVGGAVCSTGLTPTGPATTGIEQYEIGAHEADLKVESNGKKLLNILPEDSVYAIWIGTNDLGRHGFIDDMQAQGKTLNDYVKCIFRQLDGLYKLGARRFVIMNNIPLNLVGMYATLDKGGYPSGKDQYWPDKPENITTINARMEELVLNSNSGFLSKTSYEFSNGKRYPQAEAALFDTHQLFTDMYNNPSQYFNGSIPANVTTSCVTFPQINQPPIKCTNPDSYIWYDELHPSEQSSRIVASEFLNLLSGKSKYATYWH